MLPGFCTRPTDVAACFKNIAKTLGTIILDRPDLRLAACQALRTLISKGCETGTRRWLCDSVILPICHNMPYSNSKVKVHLGSAREMY